MDTHEDLFRTHDVKASSNRSFGVVFTAVFAVIAVWPLVHGAALRGWALGIAALLLVVAIAAPALLAVPNRLWMRFGLLLNRIVSPIVLGIVFFVVVTPMGVAMRLFGKDPLRLRRSGKDPSYWIPREPPGPKPDSLNNQF